MKEGPEDWLKALRLLSKNILEAVSFCPRS